jgi:predicted nucleotidyltransferase
VAGRNIQEMEVSAKITNCLPEWCQQQSVRLCVLFGSQVTGQTHEHSDIDLAERLQDAASMRNLIVHLYEQIDYAILHDSIAPALRDFSQVVALFEGQTDEQNAS